MLEILLLWLRIQFKFMSDHFISENDEKSPSDVDMFNKNE